MGYTEPRTWVTAELVTAAMMNEQVRDNLLETAPAKVTTAGDTLYATAANAIARLAKGTANQVLRMNDGATAPEWVTAIWLPLAGGTLSGEVNFADQLVTRPELKDVGETSVAANSNTAYTIDLANGNVYEVTLTGNCTFTFSNPPASGKGGSFTLILKQDATGSRTVTWPASVKWAGGAAPTITATASATDILVFFTRDAGTTWYGGVFGQAFAVPA